MVQIYKFPTIFLSQLTTVDVNPLVDLLKELCASTGT